MKEETEKNVTFPIPCPDWDPQMLCQWSLHSRHCYFVPALNTYIRN